MDVLDAILAARFNSEAELARRTVEALALTQYRAGRLTGPDLRHPPGYPTRAEQDTFLTTRGVAEGITTDEFGRQMQDLNRLGLYPTRAIADTSPSRSETAKT